MMTLDAWNDDYDLTEIVVIHLGPFDDADEKEREMVAVLTAQRTLF